MTPVATRPAGLWAPGMRLFSAVPFVGKAAIVSGVFLLVLAQSTGLYLKGAYDKQRAAQVQQAGIVTQQALQQALQPALQLRSTLTAQPAAPAAPGLQELKQRLDAVLQASGQHFEMKDAVGFVLQATEPLSKPPADVDEAFTQTDGVVQQLLRATGTAANRSGMAMETDPVTANLIAASTQETPALLVALGRVADLGAAAITAGEATPATRRIVQGETYQLYKQIERLFDRYENLVKAEPALEASVAYAGAFDAVNVFMRLSRKSLPADGAGPGNGSALREAGQKAVDALLALNTRTLQALDARVAVHHAEERREVVMQLAFVAACLLIAAYLFTCFYRVTRHGMDELKLHVELMAAGNLNTAPKAEGRDECANVMRAMDGMQHSLRALVGQVRSCANDLVQHSEGLTQTAEQLSVRTDNAVQHLKVSSGEMEAIAGHTRESGIALERSADQGRSASRRADDSLTQMQLLMTHIDALHEASGRVGEIVGVIDSIAFQTNILALNAAVEAARAGEHGRGFAVVASEVRALAQRSATAAREIKTLVNESRDSTTKGTAATREAGDSIGALADEVLRMGGALDALSRSNNSQVEQIASVAQAISQVDRESEANASLVDNTARAAQTLRDKAHELARAADRFTV
jgi:methyl-accepting chemotaxis protein